MNKKKKAALVGGTVVAAIFAVLAIIGISPAQAIDYVTSGEIADQTVQSRDIAAEGVGTSEIRNQSITSGDIAANGVGNSEVRDGSLTGTDINPNTLKRFLAGEKADADNETQDAKLSDLEDRVEAEETEGDTVGLNESRAGAGYTKFAAPGYSVQWAKCSGGKVAISGGYRLNGHASEAFSGDDQNAMPEGLTVVATEPAAEKGGVLVNSYQDPDFPQTESGSFQANAWAVTFKNDTENPLPVRVWATCVNAN